MYRRQYRAASTDSPVSRTSGNDENGAAGHFTRHPGASRNLPSAARRCAGQTTRSVWTFYPSSRRQPESAFHGAPERRPNHPERVDILPVIPAPAGICLPRRAGAPAKPPGACGHFTRHPGASRNLPSTARRSAGQTTRSVWTFYPSFRRKPESSACAAIFVRISCRTCPRNRRRKATKQLRNIATRLRRKPAAMVSVCGNAQPDRRLGAFSPRGRPPRKPPRPRALPNGLPHRLARLRPHQPRRTRQPLAVPQRGRRQTERPVRRAHPPPPRA